MGPLLRGKPSPIVSIQRFKNQNFQFIILDPMAQQLFFKMFDQDEFNEDDFMGR